jgi:hypothetical protein
MKLLKKAAFRAAFFVFCVTLAALPPRCHIDSVTKYTAPKEIPHAERRA